MTFTIARLGHLGDGIIQGPEGSIFVAQTLPGEVVEGMVKGRVYGRVDGMVYGMVYGRASAGLESRQGEAEKRLLRPRNSRS